MILPDKVYNIMKWIVITVLPALLTCFGTIGATLNLECTHVVLTIGTAVTTFLGAVIGISSVTYAKSNEDKGE